jgi:hypothetical protein
VVRWSGSVYQRYSLAPESAQFIDRKGNPPTTIAALDPLIVWAAICC